MTAGRKKVVIHLIFFFLYQGGVIMSWNILPAGITILFALAWLPACQWICLGVATWLGWENDGSGS